MLSLGDLHLERDLPQIALVQLERGSGIIAARQRRMFADWLEKRSEKLGRIDCIAVVVVPEAIYRAVLRVVYRFRAPPIRTITPADADGAVAAVRNELERMGHTVTPGIEALLRRLPS